MIVSWLYYDYGHDYTLESVMIESWWFQIIIYNTTIFMIISSKKRNANKYILATSVNSSRDTFLTRCQDSRQKINNCQLKRKCF